MNKIYFTAAVAAVALAQSSISVAEDSGFMVTPSIGFFDYEDDRVEAPAITGELDDDFFGSLGLGYRFANPWAVELVYKYGETETKTVSQPPPAPKAEERPNVQPVDVAINGKDEYYSYDDEEENK